MDLKKQIVYVLAVASLAVSGMAQKNACEPLDDGPFLATLPTLNFMIPEASDTDLQDAGTSGSKKYYSELRIFGDPTTDFNLTVFGNIMDPFEYFTVVTDAGINYLKLMKALDRDGATSSPEDDVNFIPFTLTCQPKNSNLSEKIYDARIFITDVNDNIPIFPAGNNTLNFTFSEATPVGTTLFTAVADDKDAHLDGNITYSLHNYTNLFSVDNITGAVTLTSELDYESLPPEKTITLILTAQDSELGVTYTVTASATIHVTDADDQGPAFIYQGCFTYMSVCAWPKYTTGLSLKKDQPIQVQPVPNKGQGSVTIKAADLDGGIGNVISFSIASTIPPGSENNFRVDTTRLTGNEYTASVVPLSDMTVNEGFEIFLTATEQSLTMKHAVAMILFTGSSAPVDNITQGPSAQVGNTTQGPSTQVGNTTQGPSAQVGNTTQGPSTPVKNTSQGPSAPDENISQGSVNNQSADDDDDAGYSKLEVALIVVVAILATLLLCVCIILTIYCVKNGHTKQKLNYSMGTTNNAYTERL